MSKISKDDLKNAFVTDQRKRNKLLYEYYKEEYFSKDYTARLIAAKISEDLGIPISANMIFKIYSRIIKKRKSVITTIIDSHKIVTTKNQVISQQEKASPDNRKVQNEFIFKNADEEPGKNPFDDAFKDL